MYSEITAKKIMTKKLVTLHPDDNIYVGLRTLLENGISGAPVLDDDGTFQGLFTERSCMNVVIADQYHGNKNTRVGAFTYADVVTISPDITLIEVAMIFLNNPIRRLPVVQDGKLLGQVSRRDVLRAVNETHKKAPEKIKSKSPLPYYSALIDPHQTNKNPS